MSNNRIAVVVPSRGRPASCLEMIRTINETTNGDVDILIGVDNDDPELEKYRDLMTPRVIVDKRRSLSEWTNLLCKHSLGWNEDIEFFVTMGDDHRPRTMNWHTELAKAIHSLDGPGFAYGDDMFHGSGLCTSWMTSIEIVKALGWMMVPTCHHMYVDNAIMELGERIERLAYCPSVQIEHMHPEAEKGIWDDTYLTTNNEKQYLADLRGFRKWRYSTMFEQDVRIVSSLRWI